MCENGADTLLQSNDSETVTLIALPLHLFQQATQNPLVVEQNVLLKSLPDGSLVIDTNQLYNGPESISLVTNHENSLTNERKRENEGSSTQIKNKITSPKVSPSDKSKPKVRYINCKTSPETVVRRPGRPKKQKPNDKGPFKCKTCDKEFDKWILYKRHEKAHLNEKKFKCGNCNASYNILSNYLLHVATHDTNNPTCPECGKKFQRVASLKAHLMYHEKEETFYCQDCDTMFNSDIELNSHLKDHCMEKRLSTNPLQCRFCQYKFTIQSDYKKHMSEHNKMRSILNVTQRKKNRKNLNNDRRHVCNHCKKMFQKHSQLERHMRVHSGEKPFVCSICNRGFSQKGTLQIHMVKHNGLKPHKCSFCPAKFSQKGNLRAHILKTHSVPRPGENVYSCTECSCVFKKLGSLNAHTTRNHPETKDEDIKSMISQLVAMQNNMSVDKDILQQAILRSELNSDVQNEEKGTASYTTFSDLGLDGQMRRYIIKQRRAGDTRWHQCTFCCKEFRKPSDLVRHIRIHTREKPFKCKICPRSFAVKSTLTAHLRTHSGLKDYQCIICSKIFRSLNSLNVHLKLHSTQKPHQCMICNKSFRSIALLKQHLRQHMPNGEEKLDDYVTMQEPIIITNKGLQTVDVPLKKRPLTEAGSKSRPYCCTTCGACFRNLSHLKQHNMMHTGVRAYRCSQCLRNFTSGGILKAHMLTHNKSKSFSCQPCNKQFTTNGSLRRHIESHSTTRPFICPYCYKNFKTVVTCRKHIKTHKGDSVNEAKDDFPPKINDLPYPPDLEDALADDSFNLTPIVPEIPPTQTLRADETGTVVLPIGQENLTQENIREIEDTLNNQMLNIIGNENFIDSSVYEKVPPIATTDELVNTLTGDAKIDDNQLLYQTVFVNFPVSEQVPQYDNGFDINNINNLVLSQLKFQNESLFLTDLSTININDGNVLLPFQLTAQIEQQQNEMMMVPADLEQNNIRPVENLSNHIDSIDSNLQLKLSQANIFMTDPDANIILDNDQIPNNDYLNNEEQMQENMQNITIVTNDSEENSEAQLPLIPIVSISDMPIANVHICNVCKLQFKTERQLKTHHCFNLVHVDDVIKDDTEKVGYDNTDVALPTEENKECQIAVDNPENQDSSRLEEKSAPIHKNQCTFCPKSFRKPSDLQRHLRTHTGERPFKCKECAKCFSLKSTLEGHQKIHQGVKNCLCPVCNALFATKSSLKIHMRLHTGSKPFKCSLCPVKFRTSGHLKAHLIVHYKEAVKTGKVPQDTVTRKAKMTTIIDASVQEITDPEKVTDPSSEEYTEITLENVQEHFEHFSQSDALIIDVENSVLQFGLPQEENIINMSNNILTDENGQKQNISTGMLDDKARQQIESILNKNINVEKKEPAKKCEVCNKKFQSKYFLDRHMKIHTGERSFNCEYCSKKFNQKSALEAHKRIHLGSRPYDCPYCSNTFSQRGNLKTHIKRIHLNKINEQNFTENSELNPVYINILPQEMYQT